jgi:serine/threonine protein kinase/Tol biopolymer transport system component
MDQERWHRVKEIFHSALEIDAEARRSFLDGACGGDAGLRQHVELLLGKADPAESFLETPVLSNAPSRASTAALLGGSFGPYRIDLLLGSGGMGEVYRAHDSKLGRDVALKTLPAQSACDAERLVRFRREARTLASLNHPNIAAIFGLEEFGGVHWLVLELVEGETLCGPLPIACALDYARQVAEALEAAHEKGVIHRDLKPANVKVTPKGRVKVLDFGLAKAVWGSEMTQELSEPVTAVTSAETLTGDVLGTPGYMSPEQTRGEVVDQRTDIWAFGCLLYELLSGKRAFRGDSSQETGAAVLAREPDWQTLPAKTPARIRELLRQCLQKDADRRVSTIAEVRRAVEETQRGGSRRHLALAAAALLVLGIGAALWLRGPARPPDQSQWVQLSKFPDPVSQPAFSPDGRKLVFVRGPLTDYGLGQIYVKELPDGEPVQLTHDDVRKAAPVFSPDGTRIAYTVVDPEYNQDTWVVPAAGGEPQRWLRNATGLTWAGTNLLFSTAQPTMKIVMAWDGRTSERDVYVPRNERESPKRSRASPDGKWALVAAMGANGSWDQCRVVPMDGSSDGRQVGPPGQCTFATWSIDGRWMYLTSKAGGLSHIWRQRFPDGQPEQFTSGITEEEGIAMAPEGRSLVSAVALETSSVWIHDARGERQILTEGNVAIAKFSADGRTLFYRIVKAVQRTGTQRDPGELWAADVESGRSDRVAPGFESLEYAVSLDGKQVAMEIPDNAGKHRLWLAPVDRSSPPRQIQNVEGQTPLYGPDGDIFFRRVDGSSAFLYRTHPDGTGLRRAIAQPIFYAYPFSPDLRWIRIWAPVGHAPVAAQMVSLDGGSPVIIGSTTVLEWPSNQDSVWIWLGAVPDGRTYVVPLPPGRVLPRIPEGGFHSEEEIATLPGARRLDVEARPGPSMNIYCFERHTIQRNLYRIPIP